MPPKEKNPRRSDRVSISMPVEIFGTEISGQDFAETTKTHLLSRHGAALVLSRKLAPMQLITIRNVGTRVEATARIIGQMGGQEEAYIYGVVVIDTKVNLWGINFPPLSDADKALFRLLLECNVCQAREVVYLDELESEVFEANQQITRHCAGCAEGTVWLRAPHNLPDGTTTTAAEQKLQRAQPRSEFPGSKNDRKHVRVQMKISACIRQPGFPGEEIALVMNISRGGLCFVSANTYFQGSNLEVAAPYTKGAANVFVQSRVVRVEKLAAEKLTKYGVAYLRTPGVSAPTRTLPS